MEFYVYNNSNKMLNKACLVDAITTLDLQKKIFINLLAARMLQKT